MSDKSVGEFTSLSKENLAAILALIGKEEASTSSPTAIVMLSTLKGNMKILFDKMISGDHDFATVRLGTPMTLDDYHFLHAVIPKQAGVTKLSALAGVLNSLVQENQAYKCKCIGEDQTADSYEFLIQVGNDVFL